jgi:type III pantothenate kinase
MNLLLDFGNTRIKAAVFNGNQLLAKHAFIKENDLYEWLKKYHGINNCLIGSVTKGHETVFTKLSQQFPTKIFQSNTPIPLTNLYKSALSLGSDRIAAAMGSFTVCPNKPVLTIDAGTCIKYNFVNQKNEYLGGAIAPGIQMRLKAMHHFTAALPLVEMDRTYQKLIGSSTTESILSGAMLAAAIEIDGFIQHYEKNFPDLVVFVTGGDADYLSKLLKSCFFANPDLIMIGLNSILNFNDKE